MKKLFLVLAIALSSCRNTFYNYQIREVGIVKDVNVVSTSSNEIIKTQIQTDKGFLVIEQIPQLDFSKPLIGKYENNQLKVIIDKNGNEFNVR